MNLGDAILYISTALAVLVFFALIYEQKKGSDRFDGSIKWLIRIFSSLLFLDFVLLSYYFVRSDFTISYVWQFSRNQYPIYYKLFGALSGQQGTILFWAALIGIGSLWLSETEGGTSDFIKKSQIIVVFLVIYFSFLTLRDSPFKTIYQVVSDLPKGFVPPDGNGMNPIMIVPWMPFHQFITFLGYAVTTIPFAGAVVYLFRPLTKRREMQKKEMWVSKGLPWLHVSWVLYTVSIFMGGLSAYKSFAWGGLWAWNPVRIALLLPWMILTVAIYTVEEHRLAKDKFNILAPLLVASSFGLAVYLTMATSTVIFEFVPSFIEGGVGRYIIALTTASFALPFVMGMIKYLKTETHERGKAPIPTYTKIFYAVTLLLSTTAFILFFGVTYPPIIKMLFTNNYSAAIQFFNISIYLFFILMLLFLGFVIQYQFSSKKRAITDFLLFSGLTIVVSIINLGGYSNIVDYTVMDGTSKPLIYRIMGSISALTVVFPIIYVIYVIIKRLQARTPSFYTQNVRIIGLGILAIVAVVLISLGLAFTSFRGTSFSVTLNANEVGKVTNIAPAQMLGRFGRSRIPGVKQGEGTGPYSVLLMDYKQIEGHGFGKWDKQQLPGISIPELENELKAGKFRDTFTVRGFVDEVINIDSNTYIKIVEGEGELWLLVKGINVSENINIAATGSLMFDFPSPPLSKTFDVILFSTHLEEYHSDVSNGIYKTVHQVKLAVYDKGWRMGEGTAIIETFPNGDAKRPLISRSLVEDLSVIFDDVGKGGTITLTVKLKPFTVGVWIIVLALIVAISTSLFAENRGFSGLESDIVLRGHCSGCGTCAAVCPEDAIIVDEFPTLVGECAECSYCVDQCPRRFLDSKAIEKEIHGELSEDPIGMTKVKMSVRAKDRMIREGSQNGGFVTALLAYAFDKGIIDSAIVTGSTEDWKPVPMLITSIEELAWTSGSKYSNSHILSTLKEANEKGMKKIAVVGTTCQIEGLRKIQYFPIDDVGLKDRVVFTVALFCKGSFLYRGLMEDLIHKKYSIDLKKINKIDIKGKDIIVTTDNGEIKVPMDEALVYGREGCKMCSDFTSRLSDFSVGSVGSRKGYTTVLARTKKAVDILLRMYKDEVIEVSKELDESAIEKLQVAKKRRADKVIRYGRKILPTPLKLPQPAEEKT